MDVKSPTSETAPNSTLTLEERLHRLVAEGLLPANEATFAAVLDAARQYGEACQSQTAVRLSFALESGQLGTWTWDRATNMLDLDERAAEIFYVKPHTPIDRSALRDLIVAPEHRSLTADGLQQSLETGSLYKAEYRVLRPANFQPPPNANLDAPPFRWISTSGIPTFKPGTREITGMIGTIQDTTLRKQHEETIRQTEKLAATGRLAATIAHEINNPLEAVTNLIYLCKTDPEIPPLAQRLLEMADSELARVSQIAQQTLGFYRDTTRPIEIDLNVLLEAVVDLFARKLFSKKISCSLDLAPNLRIFGLQGEVRQVFSNLLVNAIDATSSGAIRIRGRHRTCRDCKGVSIIISDSGSGIPVHVRQKLFAPFFTTKESVGTGLGLWVTRGIVEKQGGSIGFRTRTEHPSGTCFRVFLPAESSETNVLSTPQTQVLQ
jgi:signal transduction histidine kinase